MAGHLTYAPLTCNCHLYDIMDDARARELLIHDMIKMFENPIKGLIFEELIKMHNLHASSPCVRVEGRVTHDYQSKDQNTCT